MRPNLHPRLVNGRFGDPALFVEMLHRRDALLFDAGDLSALSARDLLRVTHLFVSHMHMDHFIGFDALLRVNVGREKSIGVLGPPGTIERVGHKLRAYDWDLVERYDTELVFDVAEVCPSSGSSRSPNVVTPSCEATPGQGIARAARYRFKNSFKPEPVAASQDLTRPAGLGLQTALLEHHGPCVGFAVCEPAHVNVWKSKLEAEGLPTGPWLQHLKSAVLSGASFDEQVELPDGTLRPLGELRDFVTVTRGQKIAYVTDVADTRANREAIVELARGADLFFIEARFSASDEEAARQRAHLTTTSAAEIACAAGVRRLEPFHFSARYEGEEERMMSEVFQTFTACRQANSDWTRG